MIITRKSWLHGQPYTARNEVYKITVDATGGNFTVSIGGNTTASISATATAAAVETAVELLAGVTTVEVHGGPGDSGGTTPYYLEYLTGSDTPAATEVTGNDILTAADVDLSGGGTTVVVVREQLGSPKSAVKGLIESTAPVAGTTPGQYHFIDRNGRRLACHPVFIENLDDGDDLFYKVNAQNDSNFGNCSATDFHGTVPFRDGSVSNDGHIKEISDGVAMIYNISIFLATGWAAVGIGTNYQIRAWNPMQHVIYRPPT